MLVCHQMLGEEGINVRNNLIAGPKQELFNSTDILH